MDTINEMVSTLRDAGWTCIAPGQQDEAYYTLRAEVLEHRRVSKATDLIELNLGQAFAIGDRLYEIRCDQMLLTIPPTPVYRVCALGFRHDRRKGDTKGENND